MKLPLDWWRLLMAKGKTGGVMKNLKRFEALPMLFFFVALSLDKEQLPAWAVWIILGLSIPMLVYATWSLEKAIKPEEKP